MPRRNAAPPDLSTVTIDNHLGMARDRSGTEQNNAEYRTLQNVDNSLLSRLRKRLGSAKYGGLTEASGSSVQGLFTYIDPSGNSRYIKIANQQLRQLYSGAWSTMGAASFTDATTWFAQMNAQKTGASADLTGTLTSADSTSISDSGASWTVNAHVGKIVVVGSQKKIIIANTATQILVGERFDATPTGTYNVYPVQQELYLATGSEYYRVDPAGATPALTQLDNGYGATTFTGICTHARRMWGWKNNRLYWSDNGQGENFSRNAWKAMLTDVKACADLGEVMVIYERKQITVKFNDNPDQFVWKTAIVGFGTVAPKSIGTYPGGLQFALDETLGVMVINTSKLTATSDDQVEPVSASQDYINTLIFAESAANIAAAVGYCDGENYYLKVNTTVYVLHVQASLNARQTFGQLVWIWSIRTYPTAILPNCIGKFDADLVFGGATNGQVYHINKAATYSDDSTAITMIIEKCDFNPTDRRDDKNYDALHVAQDASAGAVVMEYYFVAGGTTFGGSPDTSYSQISGTAQAKYQEIKITGNPSESGGKKDSGKTFSFKIRESSSLAVPDIEDIELHYYPSIVS